MTQVNNPISDHGQLIGLGDQVDHPWALTIDGIRPLTGNWAAGASPDVTFGSATPQTVGKVNSFTSDTKPGLWFRVGSTANELLWQAGQSNGDGARFGFRGRLDNLSSGDRFDDRCADGTNWVQMVRHYRGSGRIWIGDTPVSALGGELLGVQGLVQVSKGMSVNVAGGSADPNNRFKVFGSAGSAAIPLFYIEPLTNSVMMNTSIVDGVFNIKGENTRPAFWLTPAAVAQSRVLFFGPNTQFGFGWFSEEVSYGDSSIQRRSNYPTNPEAVVMWMRRDNGYVGFGPSWSAASRPQYRVDIDGEVRSNSHARIGGNIIHTGSQLGLYGVTPVSRPAIYTQTYATATRTHAARTAGAFTDNVGGTPGTTLAAIPDPADAPATADALRDDIVTNVLPAIRNLVSSLADQHNKVNTDSVNTAQVLNQSIDDDQLQGLKQ